MAQEFNTSLISVVADFLNSLNVPFTKSTLKRRLETNPYYPSLYSISEMLNWYKIENKGLKIETEQLDELPVPFLALMKIKEIGTKDFVSVKHVTRDTVTYFYGTEHTLPRHEFIAGWQSNIVLLAEPDANSKEKDLDKNLRTEAQDRNRWLLLITGSAILLFLGIYRYITSSPNHIASLSFLLFSLTGLTISIFLLIYEIDKSNVFVKNICTGGVKTNCDAVLGSKAAKVFGVSWGEVGFFFFGFIALFLLVSEMPFLEKVPYLSFISTLSALYIPFSIYYQYKVTKQWCRLCLAVQAILFLNLCWTMQFGSYAINLTTANLFHVAGYMLFPVLLWYSLKPVIVKAKDADKFSAAYKRLYSRPDIFNLTLSDQEEAPDGWKYLDGIEKGNPDAETIILKVCSPACGHCNNAHLILNELLDKTENLKTITIYDISDDADDDDRRFPVLHFLALAVQGDKVRLEEAMDYWYLNKSRNYETLKQKYPLPQELLDQQRMKIKKMSDWCTAAEIAYTPTVFINGRRLPETFNLTDLKEIFS